MSRRHPPDAGSGESLLERVERPQDLHSMSDEELQRLAQEVRELIIETIGEIGGKRGAMVMALLGSK